MHARTAVDAGPSTTASYTRVKTLILSPRNAGQTGSWLYMAPEVMLNKPYNEKVDIFSLGIILYEVRRSPALCLWSSFALMCSAS